MLTPVYQTEKIALLQGALDTEFSGCRKVSAGRDKWEITIGLLDAANDSTLYSKCLLWALSTGLLPEEAVVQ